MRIPAQSECYLVSGNLDKVFSLLLFFPPLSSDCVLSYLRRLRTYERACGDTREFQIPEFVHTLTYPYRYDVYHVTIFRALWATGRRDTDVNT